MTVTKIYILLDYFCFPIEGFTADGVFAPDDEIEEFRTHPELYEKFQHLQDWFDSYFEKEYPWYFKTREELYSFIRQWHETVDEFLALANGRYEVENLFEDFKSLRARMEHWPTQ